MAIKKVRERVHNGGTTGTEADYDAIYYETSEDLIVGQVQQLSTTGYRMYSGGIIEQWGEVEITIPVRGLGTANIIFPIEFPNKCIHATANVTKKTDTNSTSFVDCINSNFALPSKIGGTVIARNIDVSLSTATKYTLTWCAKGY